MLVRVLRLVVAEEEKRGSLTMMLLGPEGKP